MNLLLNELVAPPEGYDYCDRCYRLVKTENLREDDEGSHYGPKCYKWLKNATPEEILRDTIKRPIP